jgi:hypothetical protein
MSYTVVVPELLCNASSREANLGGK